MTVNDGYSFRHVLGPAALGHTAQSYLAAAFSHSSEREWRRRLDAGEILLEGHTARAEDLLRPGEILTWNRPPWEEPDVPRTYTVLHRDESVLVVDKPSGLPTLPGGGFLRNTLLSVVRDDFPAARPLHRLGRGTSGLVLFALNGRAASRLQKGWADVRKQYRALATGVASRDAYDIVCPIGRVAHERLGTVHAASAGGKPARSIARVLERRAGATVFEVDLLTGRPHQIRIHLASIGHPLVGDPLYAAGGVPRAERPGLPGDGGYLLRATRLGFRSPASGEWIEIESTATFLLPTPG